MPRKRYTLRRMLINIAVAYAGLLLVAYLFADRLIFLPHQSSYRDDGPHIHPIIKLATADGAKISAVYFPNPDAKFTVLFSHGNGEDLGDDLDFFREYCDHGFAVFGYDYHGYGTSTGTPTEQNAYLDANAAYGYVTQQLHVPPDRLLIHGKSVGGGVAIDLASRKPAAGLISQSSFVTAFRVRTHIPIAPFDKFRNIDKIRAVHYPALIMHGDADPFIPVWHSQKLLATANEPKFSLRISGAGHNDVEEMGGETYWKAITDFAAYVTAHQSPPASTTARAQ